MNEGYYVEWNGEQWQSVFPKEEADKSSLHTSQQDAISYMVGECGVHRSRITVFPYIYPD